MSGSVVHKARKLLKRTIELHSWLERTLDDLRILKEDHELITCDNPVRIAFAVDYFDIHSFVFRDDRLDVPRREPLKPEKTEEFVRQQIGRTSIFYGLPESYYPLLILPTHYWELHWHFLSGKFINVRSRKTIIDSLAAVIPNLEKRFTIIDQLSGKQTRIAPEFVEREKRELFYALVRIAPDLLFLLSGLYHRVMESLVRLLSENRVSANFKDWKLVKETRDLGRVKRIVSSLELDRHLLEHFSKVRPGKGPSNLKDSIALTTIDDLNKEYNDERFLVLLISSAESSSMVAQRAGDQLKSTFQCGDEVRTTSYLRSRESFRHYDRYRVRQKDPDNPDNEQIRVLIGKDIETLQRFDREYQQALKQIQWLHDYCGTYSARSIVDRKKTRPELGKKIKTLGKFTSNVIRFKEEIDKAQSTLVTKTYLRPYESQALIRTLIPDQGKGRAEKAALIERIVFLLRRPALYVAEVAVQIISLKFHLTSEIYLLMATSTLPIEKKDTKVPYLENFQLFPYRLRFDSEDLRADITRLNEIMSDAKPLDVGQRLQILTQLSEIANRISTSAYWKKDKDDTELESLTNPERLLVLYAFLYGLDLYDLVREGTQAILDPGDYAVSTELGQELGQFADDFRLLRILAEVELVRGTDPFKETCINILKRLHVTEETILGHPEELRKLDPRLLHVAAFIVGLGAREEDFLTGFDWATAIKLRKIAIDKINEEHPVDRNLKAVADNYLAYLLAMSDNVDDIREAIQISDSVRLTEREMFRECLHTKGFIAWREADIVDGISEKRACLQKAEKWFKLAKKRRPAAVPIVRGIEKRLKEDLAAVQEALRELDALAESKSSHGDGSGENEAH